MRFSSKYPKQYEEIFGFLKDHKGELPVIKFKEDQIAWKDEEGNSLLHLAAWRGEIPASRCIFNSIKARKLTSVQNKKGATPLALAIISGQVTIDNLMRKAVLNLKPLISIY